MEVRQYAMNPFRVGQSPFPAVGLQPPPGYDLASWGMIQAAGIFAVSVSGHSSLPAIRNSMAQPQRFGTVLSASFTAMAVLYGAVACLG